MLQCKELSRPLSFSSRNPTNNENSQFHYIQFSVLEICISKSCYQATSKPLLWKSAQLLLLVASLLATSVKNTKSVNKNLPSIPFIYTSRPHSRWLRSRTPLPLAPFPPSFYPSPSCTQPCTQPCSSSVTAKDTAGNSYTCFNSGYDTSCDVTSGLASFYVSGCCQPNWSVRRAALVTRVERGEKAE